MANPDQISLFEELKFAHPSLKDTELVRKACEQILDLADVSPPVSVERLASVRGILQVREMELPYAGLLTPEASGRLAVHIRRGDGRDRQRFTICHETGHTLFPGFSEKRSFRCKGPRTWLERMCDVAAAEFLMPYDHFVRDLPEAGGLRLDAIEELSGRYQASIEATARRAIDLSADSAMMIVLSKRHKPTEAGREDELPAKLRVDYSYRPNAKTFPYVLEHKSVGESPLKHVLDLGEVDEVGSVNELISGDLGEVRIQARPYGRRDRVIAVISR